MIDAMMYGMIYVKLFKIENYLNLIDNINDQINDDNKTEIRTIISICNQRLIEYKNFIYKIKNLSNKDMNVNDLINDNGALLDKIIIE